MRDENDCNGPPIPSSADGHAELLDDAAVEMTLAYRDGAETALKGQTRDFAKRLLVNLPGFNWHCEIGDLSSCSQVYGCTVLQPAPIECRGSAADQRHV